MIIKYLLNKLLIQNLEQFSGEIILFSLSKLSSLKIFKYLKKKLAVFYSFQLVSPVHILLDLCLNI